MGDGSGSGPVRGKFPNESATQPLLAQGARAECGALVIQRDELQREVEEATARRGLLAEELRRSEALVASESVLNEQLALGLRVLKASHQEALDVPDVLQRNYQEALHAMVEQHDEQRQRWDEERTQLLADAHQSRTSAEQREELSSRTTLDAVDMLARRAGAVRDQVRQLRFDARSELQQHWREMEQCVRQLGIEAHHSLTAEKAAAAQLKVQVRSAAEAAKETIEEDRLQAARELAGVRSELSVSLCSARLLEEQLGGARAELLEERLQLDSER